MNQKKIHQRCHPLRKALIYFMLVLFVAGQIGIYSFVEVPEAKASGDFSIKTGYYFGTGTTLSVTGLGFAPEVVIVKSDTTAGQLVWKSSSMPESVSSYLGVATTDNTESEITLDADGFTLSGALEVNTVSVRYVYIAFYGSDCTSSGVMCVGSYTGDGSTTQEISTGFQPDLVWAKRTTAVAGTFRTSSMDTNNAAFFSGTANDSTGVYFRTLDATGFTVGLTNNAFSSNYYFVAFKNLTNKLTVGQFTGDGNDNRDISGLGFEPDFVLVKTNTSSVPYFNTTECWGDFSVPTSAAAASNNMIQSLDADGFQVGSAGQINQLGTLSFYFAFGGAPDPAPSSGSFFMTRGSYTGNGSSQTINTTFSPDLVFIKSSITDYGVWSTSLDTNLTHYFAAVTISFAGGITSMSDSGFTIGSNSTVNTNSVTYEYTAFGNATSPITGAGAEDFVIGMYTGNSVSPRSIDHLGFAPSMAAMRRYAVNVTPTWSSTTMAANTSAYFSNAADTVDGTGFRSFDSSGFTIGSGTTVNVSNVSHVFFAFKEGAYFDVGSYTGTGTAQNITGLGFDPDYVWIKRNTGVYAIHRSTSATITGTYSQYFTNLSNPLNEITGFVTDGFSLGTGIVNTNEGVYQYAAWDSSQSANPPNTPTNSSPSSGATAQDLNATLTGSAYTDPDSNVQTNTQWQVDDESDFASPVWTRTAGSAESSISITGGNGTFANALAGKTELNHNTLYYWRVRYSDGVWSSWSTPTSFTTNTISTPTHSSPSNGSTITTLTPTLTASAFSDAQGGHTSSSAQWQISTTSSFTSPWYDSETVSYSTSLAVPSATLSDHSVYYWRVRYQDSSGQWSAYSTATRFLTAESVISVKPIFGNTTVDQGDAVKVDTQVKLTDGTLINDATVTIDIYNPSGTKIVDGGTMSYISGSKATYRYPYTIPATSGSYLYEVTAISGSKTGYGSANFEVRTIAADVTSAKSTIATNLDAAVSTRASGSALTTTETNLTTEVNANETKINENNSLLDSIISYLSSYLDATVSSRASQVSVDDVDTSVDGIETVIDESLVDIDTNVSSIKSTVNAMDGNIDELRSDVTAVMNQLDDIESSIDELSDDVSDVEDAVNSEFDTTSSVLEEMNTKLISLDLLDELTDISANIGSALHSVGQNSQSLHDILTVTTSSASNFEEFRNTLADLKAAAGLSKELIERTTNKVVTKTWLGFGSIIQYIVAVNPSDTISQKVQVESHLPDGIVPDEIIDDAGMIVYYDVAAERYAVLAEVTLAPGEQKQFAVEMNDVWQIPDDTLDDLSSEIDMYVESLRGTTYEADASAVRKDAQAILESIRRLQQKPPVKAEDHILQYKENVLALKKFEQKAQILEDVVTSAGTGSHLLGSIAGVQTFGMWGIILALVAGVGFMSFIVMRGSRRIPVYGDNTERIVPFDDIEAPSRSFQGQAPAARELVPDRGIPVSSIQAIRRSPKITTAEAKPRVIGTEYYNGTQPLPHKASPNTRRKLVSRKNSRKSKKTSKRAAR